MSTDFIDRLTIKPPPSTSQISDHGSSILGQSGRLFPLCCSSSPSSSCLSSPVCSSPSFQQCLRPWPQPSPGAGGWQWRPLLRICSSLLCCWDGDLSSSCSNLRASTLTYATTKVSHKCVFCHILPGCSFFFNSVTVAQSLGTGLPFSHETCCLCCQVI